MRILAAIIPAFLFVVRLDAQLPQGSIAPDFTAVDLGGQSWHLYDLLDSGKVVILEISATWCSPCWAYHNSHAMQQFYNAHGPGGDDKVRVLFIEGDPSTNTNCLYGSTGCNGITAGNWVAGTPYPILDYAEITGLYNVEYFPLILAVCPNKKVYEIGQLNTSGLWDAAKECPVASGVNNAGIFYYDKGTPLREICDTVALHTGFTLINLGTAPLTKADLELRWDNNLIDTINWTGSLSTYGEAQIRFDSFHLFQAGTLSTAISVINTGVDEDPANNYRSDQFILAQNFDTQQILLKIRTDQYGAETYWELRDDAGNVLDHGGNQNVGPDGGGKFPAGISGGPGAYGNNIVIKDTLELPADGCYSIHFVDAYGDGICCSYGNGYYRIYDLSNQLEPLISGGEFKAYDDRAFGITSSPTTGSENPHSVPGLTVYPNPAGDWLHVECTPEAPAEIRVYLLNTLGHRIFATDTPALQEAGRRHWQIPAGNFPPGLYYLRLEAGSSSRTVKVIIGE